MANTHSLDLESTSSQKASIADASQTGLDITGALTIECWVKFESLPTGAIRAFAAKYNTTGNNQSFLFGYREDGGPAGLHVRLSSGGSDATTSAGIWTWAPSLGTWYHVAMVYDPSQGTAANRVKTFVDGTSLGTIAVSWPASIFSGAAAFTIGASENGLYHDGLIDEVRVWNVNRSDANIADNRSAELVGNETNLQGYWKLNNNYTDSTANANNLTASGSPVFSTDVPFGGGGAAFIPRINFL